MGVACQVMQHVLRVRQTASWRIRPSFRETACEEKKLNAFSLDKLLAPTRRLKLVLPKELPQAGDKLAPEHAAEPLVPAGRKIMP